MSDAPVEQEQVDESAVADEPVEPVGDPVDDLPRAPARPPLPSRLLDRLILSGVVGAIVATAAVLSDVAAWAVVVAVLVAVGAFWAIDHVVSSRWAGVESSVGDAGPRPEGGAPGNTAAPVVALPPVLDAGRIRDDSVDAADLATGRTHIYRIRLAAHGEPAAGIAPIARIDARTASLAVACPMPGVDADANADGDENATSPAAAWCDRLARSFTDASPKPLSVSSLAEWLALARDDVAASESPPAALAGASIVTDRGARVAVVMVVGDAAAVVVSETGDGPFVRSVVRAAVGGTGLTASADGSDGAPAATPVWATVPLLPGDRLVVASSTIADWLVAAGSTEGDRRLELLDRPTAAEIGAGLSDERIAGRLVDGAGAVAVVALAP